MNIQQVGVVGCGLMGSGIGQVCAQSGYQVVVREANSELLAKGTGRIEKFLQAGVEKGKVTEAQKREALSRIRGTTSLDDLAACDLVIEAVTENVELKREVFATLDRICKPEALLASNTSSVCIAEMSGVTKRPSQVLGMHFFNPVPLMKLVEVVRALTTSDATVSAGMGFVRSLGKTPILAKDTPGFVVNLLLVPYLLDAVRALERGVASVEDIDQGMVLGCGYPMGPLTLLDFVGIDTTYYIANILFDEFKETRYAAPTLMKRMVLAGHHGRKTGKGFYDYPGK
jgi:3-hydroxybutyryl-CoA dehydrogenase